MRPEITRRDLLIDEPHQRAADPHARPQTRDSRPGRSRISARPAGPASRSSSAVVRISPSGDPARRQLIDLDDLERLDLLPWLSSKTSKSSCFRSSIGFPFLSVTITSTLTKLTPRRMTSGRGWLGSGCGAGGCCAGGCCAGGLRRRLNGGGERRRLSPTQRRRPRKPPQTPEVEALCAYTALDAR